MLANLVRPRAEGWWLLLPVTAVVAALVAPPLLQPGLPEAALRAGVRHTARLSMLLFLLAFVASAVNARFTSPASKWLLRNRRYIGLGFAVSQLGHAVLFGTLWLVHRESLLAGLQVTTIAGGTVGYVWTALMAATSFDATRRRIGRTAWDALHTSGMYVFWIIYVFTYVGRIPHPLSTAFTAILVAALGLRLLRRRHA